MTLPVIGKIFSLITIMLALVVLFFFTGCFTSCGSTRVTARINDSGAATISVTTNNPTSVEATPNVDIQLTNPLN